MISEKWNISLTIIKGLKGNNMNSRSIIFFGILFPSICFSQKKETPNICSKYSEILYEIFDLNEVEKEKYEKSGIVFMWEDQDTINSIVVDSNFAYKYIDFYEAYCWRLIDFNNGLVLIEMEGLLNCEIQNSEFLLLYMNRARLKREKLMKNEFYGLFAHEPIIYMYSIIDRKISCRM